VSVDGVVIGPKDFGWKHSSNYLYSLFLKLKIAKAVKKYYFLE